MHVLHYLKKYVKLQCNPRNSDFASAPPPLPPPSQVMAVSAHENMSMIAVGFKDGTVIIIRGNITRDRSSRHRVVHTEDTPGVYVTGECVEGCVCVCVCVCVSGACVCVCVCLCVCVCV